MWEYFFSLEEVHFMCGELYSKFYCHEFYDLWKELNNVVITIGLTYSKFKIIQMLGYKILCTDNYSAQFAQETVMVILVCLSLHDHKRAQNIVHYTIDNPWSFLVSCKYYKDIKRLY